MNERKIGITLYFIRERKTFNNFLTLAKRVYIHQKKHVLFFFNFKNICWSNLNKEFFLLYVSYTHKIKIIWNCRNLMYSKFFFHKFLFKKRLSIRVDVGIEPKTTIMNVSQHIQFIFSWYIYKMCQAFYFKVRQKKNEKHCSKF